MTPDVSPDKGTPTGAALVQAASAAIRAEWGPRTWHSGQGFHLAVADLLDRTHCGLRCDANGLRDPYCWACEDSGGDHECPPALPCDHTTDFRAAITVARAYLGHPGGTP